MKYFNQIVRINFLHVVEILKQQMYRINKIVKEIERVKESCKLQKDIYFDIIVLLLFICVDGIDYKESFIR